MALTNSTCVALSAPPGGPTECRSGGKKAAELGLIEAIREPEIDESRTCHLRRSDQLLSRSEAGEDVLGELTRIPACSLRQHHRHVAGNVAMGRIPRFLQPDDGRGLESEPPERRSDFLLQDLSHVTTFFRGWCSAAGRCRGGAFTGGLSFTAVISASPQRRSRL